MNKINNISKLTKKKNAVILAHYYQNAEIQDIANFVGDSLALAQEAAKTEADIIVFAGVHFMAETAKILNPDKKVLIPDMNAGCSLADSCNADEFKEFLKDYSDHTVITYVNASADVKILSDIIVTSGNAVKIVNQLPKDEKIVFAPDKNLGAYINHVTGRDMVLWDGACHVHNRIKKEKVLELKQKHQDAKIISHPECQSEILKISDFVGSTAALLSFIKKDNSKKYIVATETGILHQMKKVRTDAEFIIVSSNKTCSCNDCSYMKLNTLDKILDVLENETNEIHLSDDVIKRALVPLNRMLEMS